MTSADESSNDYKQIRQVSASWTPEQALSWGFQEFGEEIAIASGFGAEGMVVIDLAWRLCPKPRVFVLDTEFLFPETYDLMDRVERRYGISVERIFPDLSPEVQARVHGSALWSRNPDQCCALRKVEPLRRKLARLRAWITAIRRDQTEARAQAGRIEWDQKFQLLKINPIVDWSEENIWDYIKTHGLPYNVLHDRHYPSIGCTHCTRAVVPGEDPRAGRWASFRKTECGLHSVEAYPGRSVPERRATRTAGTSFSRWVGGSEAKGCFEDPPCDTSTVVAGRRGTGSPFDE